MRVKTAKYYRDNHTGNNPKSDRLEKRPESERSFVMEEIVRQCNEHIKYLEETKIEYTRENGLAVTLEVNKQQTELEAEKRNLSDELFEHYKSYVAGQITVDNFNATQSIISLRLREIEEKLDGLQVQKWQQTVIDEDIRRKVLAENQIMDAFDDTTIRRMVSTIFLEPDGTVMVDFAL